LIKNKYKRSILFAMLFRYCSIIGNYIRYIWITNVYNDW